MNGSVIHGARIGKTLIFPASLFIALLFTAAADARDRGPGAVEPHPQTPVFSPGSSGTSGISEITGSSGEQYANIIYNEGAPLAPTVGRNDICPTVPQDVLPVRRPDRHETAIAITQDILLAGPPYTAYSPLGGFPGNPSSLPRYAVKSNLLYAAGTLTPNLAVEFALSGKTSLVISGSYNPWNRKGSEADNGKLVHFVIRPEFRYWLCETFNGHFFGANPFFTRFNVSDRKIPFVNFRKGNRYEGYAVGAGVNYGYQFPLGKRWGLELAVGVGAAYMNYDVYDCILCGDRLDNRSKWYFGPTHAAINLVFLIK